MAKPPAAAAADAGDAQAVPAKGKKKLIILLAAAALVLAAGGGTAVVVLKKKAAAAAAAEAEADGEEATEDAHASAPKVPVFVPLEPFVVNLADRDSDRFAQIAITFQIEDPQFAEQIKLYMPAIRNTILMILAQKTSQELLEHSGKQALALQIQREAVRPMGIEVEPEPAKPAAAASAQAEADADDPPPSKPKKRRAGVPNPIRQVHFANFIIQ